MVVQLFYIRPSASATPILFFGTTSYLNPGLQMYLGKSNCHRGVLQSKQLEGSSTYSNVLS